MADVFIDTQKKKTIIEPKQREKQKDKNLNGWNEESGKAGKSDEPMGTGKDSTAKY